MTPPARLLFLPGASGNTAFWEPLAQQLHHPATRTHLGWPGFGPVPASPHLRGFDDLVAMVIEHLTEPTALIAQSMGGVVALHAALARPRQVTHLVLTATSGGLDMTPFGAQDWRPAFSAAYPTVPPWFADHRENLADRLPTLHIPTLLLWGDADPISPVSVGKHLAATLPNAKLHLLAGGDHDLGQQFAATLAPLVDAHLVGR